MKLIRQHTNLPRAHAGSTEHRIFSEEYFSGADVSIYFGDIWVDEVTAIEISVQENVQPIYGYASYTVDAWARGTRLVTGTFRINFKESYYLHAVLNEIEHRAQSSQPVFTDREHNVSARTIEDVLAATTEVKSTERFEHLANEYQQSIWGRTIGTTSEFTRRMHNQPMDAYFHSRNRQPNLHREGFNILLSYGPFIKGYDQIIDAHDARRPTVNHTIESITGVQIANMTKIIQTAGQPIEEQYSFIARDINYKI